jgi:hypothetical protein
MVKALGVTLLSLLSIGALARPSPQPENSKRSPDPQEQLPAKGKTLIVGIEDYADCEGTRGGEDCFNNSANKWYFFTIDQGSELGGICGDLNNFHTKEAQTFKDMTFLENPDWPIGSWDLTIDGTDYTYNDDGNTSGGLFRTIDGATVKVGPGCQGELQKMGPLYKTELCTSDEDKIVTRRTIISCDF